ncbi:MAG: glycosyltransferase family 87 protein, partial [Caulobacteraceae bacterium]
MSARTTILAKLAAVDRLVTADRVRAWSIVLLLGYAAGLAWLVLTSRHGLDPRGRPVGADFIAFYSASRMTLSGHAFVAYAGQPLLDLQRALFPGLKGACPWFYPPTLQLLIWPLARLSYGAALAVWSALGLAGYLAMIRGFGPKRGELVFALAFPGVYMCIVQGQTGLFVAALMGGGLILLDRRPMLAGLLLGFLAIKPQYGVLIPVLLAVTGRWRAFTAAAASATGLAVAASLAFGEQVWFEFAKAAPYDALALSAGALPIFKDPSVFAYLTWLGVPGPAAVAAQTFAALAAVGLCVWEWR